MPVLVQQFRRWVSRLSVLILIGGVANLAMAGLFAEQRMLRIVGSLLAIVLAVMARRALARLEIDADGAIDAIEKILISLFAFPLICAPYAIYNEPVFRSFPGMLVLLANALMALGAFWFAQRKLSEVRALTRTSRNLE